MTKFKIAKAIEQVAKELKRDPWGFHRWYLQVAYDNYKKSELEEMLSDLENELIIKRYGEPF